MRKKYCSIWNPLFIWTVPAWGLASQLNTAYVWLCDGSAICVWTHPCSASWETYSSNSVWGTVRFDCWGDTSQDYCCKFTFVSAFSASCSSPACSSCRPSQYSSQPLWQDKGGIPCTPLKKIVMLCVSLEKFIGLQRHCSNFFMSFMSLPSIWALTPSNCRCEKSKIPLSLNMLLNFFSFLTTSNEKTQN